MDVHEGDEHLQLAAEDFLVGLYQDNRYKTGEGVVKTPEVQVRQGRAGWWVGVGPEVEAEDHTCD